jgi:CheY-like chemotaxis protein
MDINLPGMDGYAALAILKADPATRDIPVVALSANAMPADVERGWPPALPTTSPSRSTSPACTRCWPPPGRNAHA